MGFDLWSDYYNVIDGSLKSTHEVRHGINPATGEHLPPVPVSTFADVEDAVEAAQRAFRNWSRTSWVQRAEAVGNFADALEHHALDFAKLLTVEQGKPVCSTSDCERQIVVSNDNYRTSSRSLKLMLGSIGYAPSKR